MDDMGSGRDDREVNIGQAPFKPARFGEDE
jgi:hypothetical protein